jgi:endonuclease III
MNKNKLIYCLLTNYPPYSEELGIDLTGPEGRFKWLLAAILYGARINASIATKTYRELEAAGLVLPDEIESAGWDRLVEVLDHGGYVRYDFSTASNILGLICDLKANYGSLEELYRRSSGESDLEKKLQDFKGIGPVTAQIFLRELRGIWDVRPPISEKARAVAQELDIDLNQFQGRKLARIESALVRLYLACCRKKDCRECLMSQHCMRARSSESQGPKKTATPG